MKWFALVESNTTGTGRDFALAARRHGLRPVLVTRDPSRYPYVAELDLDVRQVDTTDEDAVVAACRDLGHLGDLGGVGSSSDLFIRTAAATGRRLGLPAPDPDAIGRCRDKASTRRCLSANDVPVPDFAVCSTVAEAEAAAAAMAGPVVVKPSQGTGSQGVRSCEDAATAGEWARLLLADTPVILVERQVLGPEYSVEVLDCAVVGVTAKHVGSAPYFVETGHDFPAQVPAEVDEALSSVTLAALRAVGLTTGPAHVELRLDGVRPRVIEINPRLAGGLIPRLIQRATGRDLIDEVVCGAAGLPVRADVAHARHASIRFLVPGEGLVTAVSGVPEAAAMPHVVEAVCTVSPGTRLTVENSFKDRRGHVIAVADHPSDAVAAVSRAHARIEIAVSAPAVQPAS